MKSTLVFFITLFIIATTVHADGMKTIEGSVFYRERIMLPPNAEITVTLEDVSKMDVAAAVISTIVFSPTGGPPWAFTLKYDPARIDKRHRYAVRARIEVNGQLMFTNTQQIPVFTAANDKPLEILVSGVGRGRGGPHSTLQIANADLANTYWKLLELNGQPATPGVGQRELHMVLTSKGKQLRGFSGCNRFTGSYELSDSYLRFKPLAATRKACVQGMEQEQRFLKSLADVMRFIINGNGLALYNADKKLILRFEAVALQ